MYKFYLIISFQNPACNCSVLYSQVPMFLKACWHPVRGTTWPSVLQYAPTQCCSLHLYSSSPSSSSFIATSSSSGLSVIPTGKFFSKYHFYVWVWPQVWTRKRKNRPTGKGNCIIYQKDINFRLAWCYGVLYKRQRRSNLFIRFVNWRMFCLFLCVLNLYVCLHVCMMGITELWEKSMEKELDPETLSRRFSEWKMNGRWQR